MFTIRDRLEEFFVDVFLDSFKRAPKQIVLDFDATDDPVHGGQEGRFFPLLLLSTAVRDLRRASACRQATHGQS